MGDSVSWWSILLFLRHTGWRGLSGHKSRTRLVDTGVLACCRVHWRGLQGTPGSENCSSESPMGDLETLGVFVGQCWCCHCSPMEGKWGAGGSLLHWALLSAAPHWLVCRPVQQNSSWGWKEGSQWITKNLCTALPAFFSLERFC